MAEAAAGAAAAEPTDRPRPVARGGRERVRAGACAPPAAGPYVPGAVDVAGTYGGQKPPTRRAARGMVVRKAAQQTVVTAFMPTRTSIVSYETVGTPGSQPR